MLRLKTILSFNYIYYILIVLSLLIALFKIYIIKYESEYDLNNNQIIGTITNIKKNEDRYIITIKGKEKIIAYYYGNINLSLGSKVLLKGELYYPNNNTIPNSFNYKKYLNNHNIYYLMKVEDIKILQKNKNIFYNLKDKIYKKISLYRLTSDSLKAFALGETNAISDESFYNYQRNGVIHLFAIGSTQINLIATLLFIFLNKINIKKILKYLITIIILSIIIFMIDYSASVIRSLLFFILYSLNKYYDFNITTKNILFLTLFLLITFNPKIIFDIGFQYSSIASYGLIISYNKYNNNYFKSLLYISTIATLFCMPVTLINNYEINLLSPLNNLLFVPLITLIIFPASILTILLEFLEPLYFLLIKFMEYLNNLLGSITIFNIIVPKVNNIWYLVYYLLLIIFIYSRNKLYLILSLLLILSFKIKPILDNKTYVYFLDVKQGDSTLIYNKKGSILIDTGGVENYNISNNTITFMKSLGISKIDLLLITHGDMDHMGESVNLVNNFKVDKVIFNIGEYNNLETELIRVLDNKNKDYYQGVKELNIDKYKLHFLSTGLYNNENDNSNVIYINYNGYKFLFMGDASTKVESNLINKYNLTKIDFLKVGHHGSNASSSEEFINSINPKYSLISVGENNRYGHPKEKILENLSNSKIYRTDQDGSILIKINNNKYQIYNYAP
ncbi:MAG: DNA internalization-related competence protein ComEC/Rec2 [Bacilli bacterium]|nr:DNA internalization-related competence protein ComEC/Rec2 [Bacilli bacterium]